MKHGRELIYWDTCIFLAWFKNESQKDPAVLEGMQEVVRQVDRGDVVLMTSVIGRLEILTRSITDSKQQQAFLDFFKRENVHLVELGIRTAELAYEIRDYYWSTNDIGMADSIHLATADIHKADVFQTLDGSGKNKAGRLLGLEQPIAGKYQIRIQVPFVVQANLLTGLPLDDRMEDRADAAAE